MSIEIDLSGKVALVTGGSAGIGREICLRLAEAGADIAFTWPPSEDAPVEMCRTIRGLGVKVLDFQADVSDDEMAVVVVDSIAREFGELDILVCNAGISKDSVLWKMDISDWREVIAVNLDGAVNHLIPFSGLARNNPKPRSIILVSSINALRGKRGQAAYAASKAGLIGLARSAAKDLGRWQVTCNVIAPGMVDTEMISGLSKEVIESAKSETLNGRIATPRDIADVALFLSSDMSRHNSGAMIPVDGGQLL
ncbi:MAG: SDR family NAD(P)-dependent oxidoreductase [Candidatus Poseidoniaceae archaeon]|nr:SDR family NAD(P)-dependent oxidoreductase [Candidatus Poseidoniaceae archaeon]